MIPLKNAALCLDCRIVGRPTVHGRCEFCDSTAIIWLEPIVQKKPVQQEAMAK